MTAAVIDRAAPHDDVDQLRAAFEAAPNGMLLIGRDRKVLLCNRKIEEIFGYERDELLGNTVELLIPDGVKAPHPEYVAGYFDDPVPRAMGMGRELFGRHRTGRLVPVEVGLQPLTAAGQTFVISSVVDISRRRSAEAEIRRKSAEVEEFAYRTSHDLRSPLKSIVGMADCVLEDLAAHDPSSARQGVERIGSLAAKLLKLVEDILTLTKVDIADEPIAAFDFTAFASLAEDKFRALLKAAAVDLVFEFGHRQDLVVQPARLTQVLDNLIGNAAKYCDPGKPSRSVKVRTADDESRFVIEVEDNGLGIPADRQPEVFGMFKRFHSGPVQGSGLGLYIVKKQVDKLGADLGFESGPHGTRFRLELDKAPR
ncbi:MAG: PAS domain S-box protein [Planctomycetes bacterium]|nr:PAS domain S-box protein [Planctomycetota bacterium]